MGINGGLFYKPANVTDCVKMFAAALAIGISLFHLYTGAMGIIQAYALRTIHLLTLMTLIFLFYPTGKGEDDKKTISWLDIALAGACLAIDIYLLYNNERYTTREWYVGEVTEIDFAVGWMTVALLLEATRRVTGWALPLVAMTFILYTLFGSYLPYPFTIRSPSFTLFIDHAFMTPHAIFGIPLGTSATFVFLFILFAAFLENTGAGKFIMDVSLALVGGTVGGPAKVAVFASALFGCVSGHSVANVYGTGTFTIPLMKKAGYPPEYAGAVEAAASTGGQIMPPIMGAAAFLMAEFLGVSYLAVCKAAIFPALLYFLALFAATHFRARKMNLAKIGRDNLPDMKSTLFNGYHFLLPMVVLIGVLVLGYTPFRAAFLAIVALLAVASARKSSRLSFVQFVQTLVLGARSALTIAACCGCAGIIVGALDITGVGIKFVEVVMIASRGVFSLSLVLVMLACLVLGMGIPTAPAYIIVSLIAVPALIKMGILPIAAHMFVFYSCLLSAITPPVGLAAYAGAAIAGAPVMRTCVLASVLGVVIYIVPYVFVYNPALLLEGSTPFIIISVISATVGVIGLSAALERYAVTKLSPLQLVLMGGGSIMLLISNVETDVLGIIMLATGILLNNRDWKLEQKSLRIVADQAM